MVGKSVVRLRLAALLDGDPPGMAAGPWNVVAELPGNAQLSGSMSLDASERELYVGLEFPERELARKWAVGVIHLDTGEYRTVVEPGFRVGHVQANPWRTGRIQYCQETGGDATQRMWTVRADGTGNVYESGRTLMGERPWDLMRCVDYLETMPQVDTSKIGCAGLSLGG